MSAKTLLCFGYGFSAKTLAGRLRPRGWTIVGTTRDEAKRAELKAKGLRAHLFAPGQPLPEAAWEGVTHLLISAPPGEQGDPVLAAHWNDIAARAGQIDWIGYLSTTSVYGDHQGAWVDETTPLDRAGPRGQRRVDAENAWFALGRETGIAVMTFRLAGIYGPGRNAIKTVLEHKARRIDKPGQVFGRIHVADIANVLAASIAKPQAGAAYNVCDDEPAPPGDVITHACALLGLTPPPWEPWEAAKESMSDMGRSFYGECKRCRNDKIKTELGVTLQYPTYREGLAALVPTAGF